MLHRDDDFGLGRIGHQVHGAAEAFDLAGQHPVGQVALGAHLHGAEDGQVDAAGADHAEGLVGAEDAGAGEERDGFFAGVDEVGVFAAGGRVRAEAQDAVFGLQLHFDAGVDEGGSEHGHADAEVRVHAVFELLGGATDDALALRSRGAGAEDGEVGGAFGPGICEFLDAFLGRGLDDALDVDAGQVHGRGVEGADVDDVFGFDDGAVRVAAHGAVEVRGCVAELAVPQPVRFPGFDEGVVAPDGLFHDVGFAREDFDVAWGAVLGYASIRGEAEGEFAGLDHRPEGSGRVEGGDSGAAGATALRKGALRSEL